MESFSAPTTLSVFAISKSLNHGFPFNTSSIVRTIPAQYRKNASLSAARKSAQPLLRYHLECVPNSAASFCTSGGGGGGGEDSDAGDGGGGGWGGGDVKSNLVADGVEEGSSMSSDVILLNVGGMTCGGCVASVKKILESQVSKIPCCDSGMVDLYHLHLSFFVCGWTNKQPQVSCASVDLTTETATVWPVSEAKAAPDWQIQLGQALAKHLTSCGFTSYPCATGPEAVGGDA
ncbi:Copper-transporting ATPase PAA1, chloroplastic [Linum perenne]